MDKYCVECGEKLRGREDKKFCNDACRNAYNNKRNKDSTNLMRNTHNVLRKNYRILSELNTEGKTRVSAARLKTAGFNFQFITSVLTTRNQSTYFFVYDQGYLPLDDNMYILVKKN